MVDGLCDCQVVNLSANDITKGGVKRVSAILSVLKGCEVNLEDNDDDASEDSEQSGSDEEPAGAAAAKRVPVAAAEDVVFDIRGPRGALTGEQASALSAAVLRWGCL